MMSRSASSLTSTTAPSNVTGTSYDRQLTDCYPADSSGSYGPHTSTPADTSTGGDSALPTKGRSIKLADMCMFSVIVKLMSDFIDFVELCNECSRADLATELG